MEILEREKDMEAASPKEKKEHVAEKLCPLQGSYQIKNDQDKTEPYTITRVNTRTSRLTEKGENPVGGQVMKSTHLETSVR